jgi:hypothetical protein
LIGNILASTSISLATGAGLNGRALAQTGGVTLDNNTITGATCLVQTAATPTATVAAATPTATVAATTPTATPVPPTATPVPPTAKPAQPTATHLPVFTALPGTGGAPIQNEDFPWSLVIAGGFSAIALFLGIRAYRNAYRPK